MTNQVELPGTRLSAPPIALGTAEFGTVTDKAKSLRMMDAFVSGGGKWIDTARVYADWIEGGHGQSELTVGAWLRESGLRDQVLLSTKGAHPPLSDMSVSQMDKASIVSDLDESLRCLGVDTIDLYWLHRDDRNVPVDVIIDILHEQVQAGKIRHYGCSNWKPDRIGEAAVCAEAKGVQPFVASQIKWSLADINAAADRDPTTEEMDAGTKDFHLTTGLPIFAYTSQARGLFQKWLALGESKLSEELTKTYVNDVNRARFQRASQLAGELGVSIDAIVLGYLTSQPFPVIPIVGSRNVEQVEDALKAASLRLDKQIISELESI